MMALQKIHWAGVGGLLMTVGGATLEALRDASVLPFLPRPLTIGIIVAGAVWQGVTRAVNKGDVVEVKKVDALEIPHPEMDP
jgi:hypothetical protein